jgi:hypothetical protein
MKWSEGKKEMKSMGLGSVSKYHLFYRTAVPHNPATQVGRENIILFVFYSVILPYILTSENVCVCVLSV